MEHEIIKLQFPPAFPLAAQRAANFQAERGDSNVIPNRAEWLDVVILLPLVDKVNVRAF